MKFRYLLLVASMALISLNASAKDWKKIRIGVEGAYPPFSQTNPDGSVTGFDIDIANALCKQLKAKCTLVKQDWDGMIPALVARKYDAIIASMSITEERKKKVSFSNKYYASPARFVSKKGASLTVSKAGLKGKSVAVQRGTVMEKFLTDEWAKVVTVRSYNTQDEANLDLTAGRVDLGFMEFGTAESFLDSDGGKKYEMIGPSYADPKWFGEGIGIAVRKKDNDLRSQLNSAIKAIRANGTYDKLRSKYFSYDIYGE